MPGTLVTIEPTEPLIRLAGPGQQRSNPQPTLRSMLMSKDPFSCPHPDDPETCRKILIEAHRQNNLASHCCLNGLRQNLALCRTILREGLQNHFLTSEACKQVVLLGYPLSIPALQATVYEAFYRLVRTIIYKKGFTDTGRPAADDIFQEVFQSLHRFFLTERKIEKPLSAYVTRVAINECSKGYKASLKHKHVTDHRLEQTEESKSSASLLPAEIVESWEHLDHQLLQTEQGDLANRVILAHLCLESFLAGKAPTARQLRPAWRQLAELSTAELSSLHEQIGSKVNGFRSAQVVTVSAELINSERIEIWQVAIPMAAAAGRDVEQTALFLAELRHLSANAVCTRLCRIRRVLRPPKKKSP